jgi:hypothetical protein
MLGRRWRRNRFNEEERSIDVCGAEELQRRVGYKFAERALSGTSASPTPPRAPPPALLSSVGRIGGTNETKQRASVALWAE